jgi:hypothetical protein
MTDVVPYLCEACTGADIPENVETRIVCVPLDKQKQPWCPKNARVLGNKFIMSSYDGKGGCWFDGYYLLDKTKAFEVSQWCEEGLRSFIVLVDIYCESCCARQEPEPQTEPEPKSLLLKLLRDMDANLKRLTSRVERLEAKKSAH